MSNAESISPPRLRIAYVCLVPDAGHLLPLVRIAALLSRSSVDSLVVCPEEVQHLAAGPEFEVATIGPVRPHTHAASLSALCGSSPVRRDLFVKREFGKNYFLPIQANVLRELEKAKAALEQFGPHLLVTDDHLFTTAYKWLSEACGVPLVLNHSAGSCLPIVRNRPWIKLRPRRDAVVKYASLKIGSLTGGFEALRSSKAHKERVQRRLFLAEKSAELRELSEQSTCPTVKISVGLGVLEQKYLGDLLSLSDGMTLFPTVPPLAGVDMPRALRDWLEAVPDMPVVYACFGTMTPARLAFGRHILAACRQVRVRLLWSGKVPPSRAIPDSEHVRWETWVPQVEVLAHPSVRAFVSHAGAGSVQEALWFGKPMLAIPLVWDQYYNSWALEQMGWGLRMDKLKLTRGKLARGLARLLHEPQFRRRARSLSKELRHLSASCDVSLALQKIAGRERPWLPGKQRPPN